MKIYLGLFGLYRTFEKTYKNLFSNLIDNNPNCSFDIHINTETNTKYTKSTKKYYTENELNILFQKYYKSHLKKINYSTPKKGTRASGHMYSRVKFLINEQYNNDNEKYDLYFFMRIDCIFLKKLDLYNYANKLDKNMVKMICSAHRRSESFDHDRDWDMGIVSKNIDNIYKRVSNDFNILKPNPDNNELKKMAKIIKCNNIFTKYNLPLPYEIEKQYKSGWEWYRNLADYSFNKLIAPLWYEDEFFLRILR